MGIDWMTLTFEVLNFLVLLWLLNRWVFRLLGKAIRERREAVARSVAAAEADRAAAAETRAEVERERRDLGALRDRVRQEALEDAVAERARLLERAREDAAAERGRVRQLLESERQAAEEWVRVTAIERSTQLAGKLLLALAPEALGPALLDRLIEVVHARGARDEGDGDGRPLDVEVVGAAWPDEATLDRIRTALAESTGRTPRLEVSEDPSLLAGLRLRVEDALLDASLAGQLEAFRDLARRLDDDRSPPEEARA